jgi:hypothetical protein
MIATEHQEKIPCASYQSWNGRQKKFSCNPNFCKGLSEWMQEHASIPSVSEQIQVHLPETATQYVV